MDGPLAHFAHLTAHLIIDWKESWLQFHKHWQSNIVLRADVLTNLGSMPTQSIMIWTFSHKKNSYENIEETAKNVCEIQEWGKWEVGDIAVNQSSLDRKCWNVQRQKKSFWILMSDPRRFTAGTIFYEAWMAPSNHYLHLQVNLFLKSSFLHQLNHNMTRDCSLNSQKNTSSQL